MGGHEAKRQLFGAGHIVRWNQNRDGGGGGGGGGMDCYDDTVHKLEEIALILTLTSQPNH